MRDMGDDKLAQFGTSTKDLRKLSQSKINEIKASKDFQERKRNFVFAELAKELRANAPRFIMNAISANPILRRNAEQSKSANLINVTIPDIGLTDSRFENADTLINEVNKYIRETLDAQRQTLGEEEYNRLLQEQLIPESAKRGAKTQATGAAILAEKLSDEEAAESDADDGDKRQ
jgi:hypothetical protein